MPVSLSVFPARPPRKVAEEPKIGLPSSVSSSSYRAMFSFTPTPTLAKSWIWSRGAVMLSTMLRSSEAAPVISAVCVQVDCDSSTIRPGGLA
ncbi:MAG: hypothetical protein QNK04_00895 [Myxococcota bacterium]|nr:hypothetical protein [Myxococcota bacterium]